jgi:hypothetical protein
MANDRRVGLRIWDRLVLLVAWLVTCGLVYLLGFYVGRGTQEHRLGLEDRVVRLPLTSAPPPEGQRPKSESELTFYDTLVAGQPSRPGDGGAATPPKPAPTQAAPMAVAKAPESPAPAAAPVKPAVVPVTTPVAKPTPAPPAPQPVAKPAPATAPPVVKPAPPAPGSFASAMPPAPVVDPRAVAGQKTAPPPVAAVPPAPPTPRPAAPVAPAPHLEGVPPARLPPPAPAPAAAPTARTSPPKPVGTPAADGGSGAGPAPYAAAPAPAVASTGTGSWTVLASPTRSREEAESLLGQLRQRGYDATLVRVQRDGDAWYRLRVGRYASAEQAAAVMHKLREHEGVEHAFVANE